MTRHFTGENAYRDCNESITPDILLMPFMKFHYLKINYNNKYYTARIPTKFQSPHIKRLIDSYII